VPDEPDEVADADVDRADVDSADVDHVDVAEAEAAGDGSPAADAVKAAERRRRLAEVFGDVLPESTRDDRVEGTPSSGADDRWYTENRPPHHGG
jgi:hypothetical protein